MARGHFEVKKITSFSDIVEGKVVEIPESDLTFQDDKNIVQLTYKETQDVEKREIRPGFYTLSKTSAGIVTSKVEFKPRILLEDIGSTSKILGEARTFFKKLDVYEKLGRPKKRGVLLYSAPGLGKSSSIEKFCLDLYAEDKGTVVLVWPTSSIDSDDLIHFFTHQTEYKDCTRLVLVMEDIGGGEREQTNSRAVDSGMLNLLDGIGLTWKLPTFIVATTNHPESLLKSLADRPGRFDLMLKLEPPTWDEKVRLMEFIAKRTLTDKEKDCLGKKGTENFSIAHLEEIAVRSLLHEKTYMEVVDEMIAHSKLFEADFEEKEEVGFGFGR